MSDVRFELDKAAFGKLVMRSPEMLEMTRRQAAAKAGQDTHLKSFVGFDRAKTIIYPNTKEHPE